MIFKLKILIDLYRIHGPALTYKDMKTWGQPKLGIKPQHFFLAWKEGYPLSHPSHCIYICEFSDLPHSFGSSLLAHYWLTIGSLLAHYWLTIGSLLAHYWLTIGSLLAHYWLIIGSLLAHYWLTIGSLLAHYWLTIGSLLAHYWLTIGSLLAHYWLTIGSLLACPPCYGRTH